MTDLSSIPRSSLTTFKPKTAPVKARRFETDPRFWEVYFENGSMSVMTDKALRDNYEEVK